MDRAVPPVECEIDTLLVFLVNRSTTCSPGAREQCTRYQPKIGLVQRPPHPATPATIPFTVSRPDQEIN